ncbi:helix-turn-helix transcriptional regulator [Nocardioides antri]|uniref:Helix-turn-helix transcriptional regulator n=2 Tax=Nocardioides antri TaxID=2607659 RepID=A0A5B1LZL0_9ACTN|nr:helix-turn-helix transcriptional regulator [Nocardioides antri]
MQRADAARNTEQLLAAAARLFAERDPAEVTMEEIAQAAGVGKATLYRRFPDRASIAAALLGEHETELQEAMLRGEPPLGPGAPPGERLAAFYGAMVELLERHGRLVLGTEVGHERFSVGAYGFWRAHVLALLREADCRDPQAMVDLLLAPVAPEVYLYQRRRLRVASARIRTNLEELARRMLG